MTDWVLMTFDNNLRPLTELWCTGICSRDISICSIWWCWSWLSLQVICRSSALQPTSLAQCDIKNLLSWSNIAICSHSETHCTLHAITRCNLHVSKWQFELVPSSWFSFSSAQREQKLEVVTCHGSGVQLWPTQNLYAESLVTAALASEASEEVRRKMKRIRNRHQVLT